MKHDHQNRMKKIGPQTGCAGYQLSTIHIACFQNFSVVMNE